MEMLTKYCTNMHIADAISTGADLCDARHERRMRRCSPIDRRARERSTPESRREKMRSAARARVMASRTYLDPSGCLVVWSWRFQRSSSISKVACQPTDSPHAVPRCREESARVQRRGMRPQGQTERTRMAPCMHTPFEVCVQPEVILALWRHISTRLPVSIFKHDWKAEHGRSRAHNSSEMRVLACVFPQEQSWR